jgi:hypothetical protein
MASIANAQASTGPRSEAGLATSSKNAIKTGLYAANDFIRPGEEADYAAIAERLVFDLSPVTLLEENLTDEILRALWKLRRCAQVEGTFAAQLTTGSEPIPDPMQNEAAANSRIPSTAPARSPIACSTNAPPNSAASRLIVFISTKPFLTAPASRISASATSAQL